MVDTIAVRELELSSLNSREDYEGNCYQAEDATWKNIH
jgi:hypothetical protein